MKEKIILHLCADTGSDSKPYKDAGYNVWRIGSDIGIENFHPPVGVYGIIANPPYSLAQEFILKAKEVATQRIIFLLPLAYLHGKKRYDTIWTDRDFPLARVYVFTRYPMLGDKLRKDGKYRTGMMVYAWYVWDKKYKGKPIIEWIDNNEYVL